MPDPAPDVSVLMAAYNSEATLERSVRSVLAQSCSSLELLVIDDASERPASVTLSGIRDERLRVIRHERNRGVAAARNTGLAAARGPLVAQLDGDDVWHEDYLASILPCFENPGVGLAYSNAAMVGVGVGDGQTYIADGAPHPVDTFPALLKDCPVPAPAVTMRTQAVRTVHGYATWLWSHEDHHLYVKLALAGWRFAYVDQVLASYVVRPDAMSARKTRVALDHLWMLTVLAIRHPFTPGTLSEWGRVSVAAARRLGREVSSSRLRLL